MKTPRSNHPPYRIPRAGSLLQRLQQITGPEGESYLDQLMSFLEAPPPKVRDRWKAGAEMCADWGVACTGASVWRLYRSYIFEWRDQLTGRAAAAADESDEALKARSDRLTVQRTLDVLADPQTPASLIVGLARIEVRKMALELHREKRRFNGA